MRNKWIIPSILGSILVLLLIFTPVTGDLPTHDPLTGRDYDMFGGFFDSYGQYVDTKGGVMDRYGVYVPNSYSSNTDTYYDSQGQIYGNRVLAGQLKEGSWLISDGWAGPPIYFTRNGQGGLVGTYTNNAGAPYTLTINTNRRFVGTDEAQIASNLQEMSNPNTQEKIFTFSGEERDVARELLQKGYIDDDGYLNTIIGTISNPNPSSCSIWDAGIMGVSYQNGKRFAFSDWYCYSCKLEGGGTETRENDCYHYTDLSAAMEYFEINSQFIGYGPKYEADWLGDGQDIQSSSSPQSNSNLMPTGSNPAAQAYDSFYKG